MSSDSKKILITGGAGFIGSNFVHYWVKNYPNDEVVVLDKLTYAGNQENLDSVKDKIKFIKGDICDKFLVNECIQEVDKIVHFAAESHVDRSIKDPGTFIQTNVYGTLVLLQAACTNEVKHFHHVSTDEVFGSFPLTSKKKWDE